ncbi:methyl-accepting chemotaxis protein, partial [Candidatus Aerophobetes bacterium]
EEIQKASNEVAQKAEASLEKVNALQKLLDENRKAVEELIQGISDAAEASATSAKNVHDLELRAREIDKIVDAIANVTIQTNMLAVNGAIEAAGAGEHGRGFAVVASDIRNLASESAQNADKIKDSVRGIQEQIARVAQDIEQVGITAREEVERAKKTTQALAQAAQQMADVQQRVEEIKNAAAESLKAI